MIIILNNSKAAQIKQLLNTHFGGKTDIFTHGNRIALNKVTPDQLTDDEKAGIADIIMDHPGAVQSSRALHPEDTIIKLPHTQIGGYGNFVMMAGPCSVESEAHVSAMAKVAKDGGATVLRGGAFKPRTSPYSFQGLGVAGLKYLREAADKQNMDMITEVMDEEHLEVVCQYADMIQIGARNMQNFSLLKAVGKTRKPVLLKRGMSATIDDLLNAAEYIAAGGNTQIALSERGVRTFDDKYTRNTFDVSAVPVLKKLTHYPIIADPSHAEGHWDLVTPMALAATASGSDGIVVEIHDNPEKALSDGPQALKPKTYKKMTSEVFALHDMLNSFNQQEGAVVNG
ncbi:3-deoxy-7-phosphoheptulonate synthase [Paucilactobacillus vaccinostercus DSM 20634]|jgi:phospho-2-dehydro-3-deoxyheptonate aldolase|uniref:3-deoxy-7-phosphoheptulonate synthase n=1 Tax=Paucilactobacillus vaccinostercus DSM 20634 TaxID=1423813 RepID=A0A0R2A834_9LACO|nr:3-deoxy-7-phosphoheptulonate synthase [Paucilactobacillus vaccinostercus]KRM61684.1 3-deoxy-7-phosphoheptulonate synthase [Paucilactobacillus vaccinostercus DSM 20634]